MKLKKRRFGERKRRKIYFGGLRGEKEMGTAQGGEDRRTFAASPRARMA